MLAVLSFYVSSSHPDFKIIREQSNQARRLYNTINKLKQEKSEKHKNPNCQTPIANSLSIDLSQKYSEKWRKQIEQSQNIHLPQKISQHVSKNCDKKWEQTIEKRVNGQKANNPKYKKKYCELTFTKQAISQSRENKLQNRIIPSGWNHGFLLPKHVKLSQIQSLNVIPRPDGFEIKALYKTGKEKPKPAEKPKVFAGGDLGLNNLITIVTTDRSRPKVVKSLGLKSLNRFYNKKIGQIRSKMDKSKGGEKEKFEKEIARLWLKRDRQVYHFLSVASNEVVRYLLGIGVQQFVIGWSDGFKNEINLGRKNNQNFVSIPHSYFRDMLIRKCKEVGIEVIIQEESYTSKASFVDGDFVPVFDKSIKRKYSFSGRRVSRGEYCSESGVRIHADVNGAWNILRKCKPSIGWSSGVVAYPENLKLTL